MIQMEMIDFLEDLRDVIETAFVAGVATGYGFAEGSPERLEWARTEGHKVAAEYAAEKIRFMLGPGAEKPS